MINLRPYQKQIIIDLRQACMNHRSVLLQLPTGGGKTVIASFVLNGLCSNNLRAWFIVHRKELIFQTCETLRSVGLTYGVISAGEPMRSNEAIQVCGIQTLKNRLDKLPAPDWIIFDEAHHLAARTWDDVYNMFPEAQHIGLTATPCRLDGSGLNKYFDTIVHGPTVQELINIKYLSKFEIYAPPPPDLNMIKKNAGDYAIGQLANVMDNADIIGNAVTHYKRYAKGLQFILFAVNIEHSKHIVGQFNEAGIRIAHLDGDTKADERQAIIKQFADGEILGLSNVNLFGEGFDLAAMAGKFVTVDCVILLRPTYSLGLYLQQVGRCLRPKDRKTAVILDHAGNCRKHGFPDDEREWTLDGIIVKPKDTKKPEPYLCLKCYRYIRRPLPNHCPECGEMLKNKQEIPFTEESGELIKLTEDDRKQITMQRKADVAQCRDIAQLQEYAKQKGYKPGWAQHILTGRQKARAKYGN